MPRWAVIQLVAAAWVFALSCAVGAGAVCKWVKLDALRRLMRSVEGYFDRSGFELAN